MTRHTGEQLQVKIRYWNQITQEYGEWVESPKMSIEVAKQLLAMDKEGSYRTYDRGEIVCDDLFDF
jgi:hypothetical protein